jgi:hypothetical protein
MKFKANTIFVVPNFDVANAVKDAIGGRYEIIIA